MSPNNDIDPTQMRGIAPANNLLWPSTTNIPFTDNMVTYNMSTKPAEDDWERLSGLSGDQGKPARQSPPSYYAAPNPFATSSYNAEVSPVAASAGSRRFGSSSYALPSTLPTTIEMHDLGEPSQSPYNIPTTNNSNTLPPPVTQSTSNSGWQQKDQHGIWFPCLLTLILLITSISLHPPHFSPEAWSRTRWSRPGHHEKLNVEQVIFATVPQKFIWSNFLSVLMLNVWVLQFMYWYGGFAAKDSRRGKTFRKMKPLFFLVVVMVEAVFMWGWLLWTI
ncbi:hypothetical protein D6D19_07784 [Aureobasidium pullulans]|uniref:Uncharacterized protein n=1 Tax=Aureobasidium pullulans TaxID=5580 RepID=A0A4S8ZVU2_AURPU|nr:hypothetical protein D6D19_07784 [Aureobasidium pullulans]THW81081.1 hypothetical protein D6D18_09023 [Aureobasidium pullulans]